MNGKCSNYLKRMSLLCEKTVRNFRSIIAIAAALILSKSVHTAWLISYCLNFFFVFFLQTHIWQPGYIVALKQPVLIGNAFLIDKCFEGRIPNACLRPEPETDVDGIPFTVVWRQVAQRCTSSHDPQHAIEISAIILRRPRPAAAFGW